MTLKFGGTATSRHGISENSPVQGWKIGKNACGTPDPTVPTDRKRHQIPTGKRPSDAMESRCLWCTWNISGTIRWMWFLAWLVQVCSSDTEKNTPKLYTPQPIFSTPTDSKVNIQVNKAERWYRLCSMMAVYVHDMPTNKIRCKCLSLSLCPEKGPLESGIENCRTQWLARWIFQTI